MNLGLSAILLIAAVVCFIIAIFSDLHQGDWIAIGLACLAGSFSSATWAGIAPSARGALRSGETGKERGPRKRPPFRLPAVD